MAGKARSQHGGARPGSGRPPKILVDSVSGITEKGAYYVAKAFADKEHTDWEKAEKFGLPLALKAIPNLNQNENLNFSVTWPPELVEKLITISTRNDLERSKINHIITSDGNMSYDNHRDENNVDKGLKK